MTEEQTPSEGLGRLAGQLAELARERPEELQRRVAALTVKQQAELALRLPAAQRMDLMLHAPRPMRLVRALPDAELYLTVREIGPSESLQLLGLASASQIQHVIDLESWRKDRFDANRAGAWVAVLLEASEPALKLFLKTTDEELLSLLFHSWIRVETIEVEDGADVHGHGEGESETEQGFLSPDGNHRFKPAIPDHAPAIRRILQIFFTEQSERYQRVLWASLWELPSDLEEQALHWRESRMEEHGFPRWDDAFSIFAPPAGSSARPTPLESPDGEKLGAARSPLRVLTPGNSLVAAIDGMADVARERILHEIVSLANHLLIAEGSDTGDPEAHRAALETAGGYLEVAFEAREAHTDIARQETLEKIPVVELFREGFGRAVSLQDRARNLVQSGATGAGPDRLALLDSPIREQLAGLLEPRPRFYDIGEGDLPGATRAFRSGSEIDQAKVAVEMAELLADVLVNRLALDVEHLSLQGETAPVAGPRFSTLVLTMLAWSATRDTLRIDPLPADVAAEFLRNVASRRTAAPDAPERAFDAMLRKLSDRLSMTAREVALFRSFGRFCLEQLTQECGSVDPGVPPDRNSISCLIL